MRTSVPAACETLDFLLRTCLLIAKKAARAVKDQVRALAKDARAVTVIVFCSVPYSYCLFRRRLPLFLAALLAYLRIQLRS
jgi:hypothetical protein